MIIDRPQAIPYDFHSGPVRHVLSVGDVGIAKSTLQPAGKISINGVDFEAVCITGIISEGAAVIVTDIEMNVATVESYDADVASTPLEDNNLASATTIESTLLTVSPDSFDLKDLDPPKDS